MEYQHLLYNSANGLVIVITRTGRTVQNLMILQFVWWITSKCEKSIELSARKQTAIADPLHLSYREMMG